MTHAKASPSYFLVSNEVIDAYATLPYLGNWDFKKAENLILYTEEQKKKKNNKFRLPSRDSKEYMDFILSISGGIPSCSPEYNQLKFENNIVTFENNIVVNLNTKEVFIPTADGKSTTQPESMFYIHNGEFQEKTFTGGNIPKSLLLINQDKNHYTCLLLDKNLARSLVFRLYYLRGEGLSGFIPYIYKEDPATKTTIMVYKINWPDLNQ